MTSVLTVEVRRDSPLNEVGQQFVRLAEGAVSREERAHKLRVGVHVVSEPLDQLQQRSALDGRAVVRPLLVVLEHDVLVGVLHREPETPTSAETKIEFLVFKCISNAYQRN